MTNPLNIITPLHKKTKRDYLARMVNDKISCMKVAKEYGREYWDGLRQFGYGGYVYDGRQAEIAKKLFETYKLKKDAKILDVGCGKGFLIYEFKKMNIGSKLSGFDISEYAINNSIPEVRKDLFVHKAQDKYPFQDKEFDLVISITTLHNLAIYDLKSALQEIQRVGKNKYVAVESYRTEKELFNLQCWALTCQSFFNMDEWIWLFKEFGYTGDYEFVFFE
jgi:SAM-dependent methyltransferase